MFPNSRVLANLCSGDVAVSCAMIRCQRRQPRRPWHDQTDITGWELRAPDGCTRNGCAKRNTRMWLSAFVIDLSSSTAVVGADGGLGHACGRSCLGSCALRLRILTDLGQQLSFGGLRMGPDRSAYRHVLPVSGGRAGTSLAPVRSLSCARNTKAVPPIRSECDPPFRLAIASPGGCLGVAVEASVTFAVI